MDSKNSIKASRSCSKRETFYILLALGITTSFFFYNGFNLYNVLPVSTHLLANANSPDLKNDLSSSDDMPSIRGTAITEREIQESLESCQAYSITLDKSCKDVHHNSRLYWRSIKTEGFSLHDDFQRISKASRCCAFNHAELISPSVSDELFPWEKDYLSQGPLSNILDTAWATKSSVEFADEIVNKTLYIGNDVRFKIRIRNGRGKDRERGGDSVRVWLVNKDIGASVVAKVVDVGNGTYLAMVKLPWSGKAVVRATIAHTRELFRSQFYLQRLFKTVNWLVGSFNNSNASEATPCLPLPFLPGFLSSEICDLTKYNGGNPWYCGKPVKKSLTCDDIRGVIRLNWTSVQPITEVDRELVILTERKRPFLIPTDIQLKVAEKPKSNLTTLPVPTLECRQRDLTTTFKEPSTSTGYFYQNKWRPFACRLPKIDTPFSFKCLKNTTFIIIGDSNSRSQMYELESLTNCTEKIKKSKVKMHAPLRCDVDEVGLSIQFYPQKYPFYGSWEELMTEKMLTSAITKMDSIPATGRYIIHLHYFLHVVQYHLSMTRTRLKLVRGAIARLLARNPTTYIAIQSPHVAYEKLPYNNHKLNIFLFDITKSILSGLGKRVMFVNTMDLTIANENHLNHPLIPGEFMKIYLGHLCGRW